MKTLKYIGWSIVLLTLGLLASCEMPNKVEKTIVGAWAVDSVSYREFHNGVYDAESSEDESIDPLRLTGASISFLKEGEGFASIPMSEMPMQCHFNYTVSKDMTEVIATLNIPQGKTQCVILSIVELDKDHIVFDQLFAPYSDYDEDDYDWETGEYNEYLVESSIRVYASRK